MINITYLPSNDPFHAVFRMFVLFPNKDALPCPVETARILDFYVCFPFLVSSLRAPKNLVKIHNALKRRYLPSTYQVTPRPAVLFRKMGPAQGAAMSSLQAYGYFDVETHRSGAIKRTSKPMPEKVNSTVASHTREHAELIAFLNELKAVSPYGPSGLKARSELEEFRYDDV